jgi:hypothetical protein
VVEAERWSRGGKGERLLEGLVCEGSHVPPGGGACQALGVPEEGLVQKTEGFEILPRYRSGWGMPVLPRHGSMSAGRAGRRRV